MKHQELAQVIRRELFGDENVLALILYGSVSRNEENTNSDIDFIVITNNTYFQKRQIIRDRITVELLETPLEFLKNMLAGKDAPVVHALSSGIVLFDKISATAELVAEAKRILEFPPEYPTWGGNEERRNFKRAEITDMYNDLLDVDDAVNFNFIAVELIGDLVPLVIENNRLWYHSRKRRWNT